MINWWQSDLDAEQLFTETQLVSNGWTRTDYLQWQRAALEVLLVCQMPTE